MRLALALAAGLFCGVLLVAILGGAKPARTATVTVTTPGPAATTPPRPVGTAVPELRGRALDDASDELTGLGLRPEVDGGGLFGVVVEANWDVVDQDPAPGARVAQGSTVRLAIERR
jgi:beta-lactam-binding protein with PASTA domain